MTSALKRDLRARKRMAVAVRAALGLLGRGWLIMGGGGGDNGRLYFVKEIKISGQKFSNGFPALGQELTLVLQKGAGFFDDAGVDGDVEKIARNGNAAVIKNVKLGDFEGRGDFVFDDLGPVATANNFLAFLDIADLAHVNPDRGVELQGPAAGSDFGVTEHDADFFAQLVGEDNDAFTFADGAGHLAQSLAHQTGLETHNRVAHFAFDFGFGN